MSKVVSWNLELSINDGKLTDFQSLMDEMVASTKSEVGTLAYEWFISADKSICHVYERYASSEDVLIHLGNFGNFAERFLACATPARLHVYGVPNTEVKAGLDGFGAVYLGTFGGFSR